MPNLINTISPEKTAILVIDMINDLIEESSPACVKTGNAIAPKLGTFLNECRNRGIKVIYCSTTYRKDKYDLGFNNQIILNQISPDIMQKGTKGTQIYHVCAPKSNDIIIEKQFYSAFYCTELDVILRANGIDTLVITGICTDTGVHATARDGFYLDYDVVVLSDLTATRKWPDCGYGTVSEETSQRATLNNLYATNSDVMNSETFLNY